MSFKDKLSKLMKKTTRVEENIDSLRVEFDDDEDEVKELLAGKKDFNENTEIPHAKSLSDFVQSKYSSSYDLDDKVDEFIDWYFKNMVKGHFGKIGEYYEPQNMRNFIEKMAVWYELRYPDYEINRLMYCAGKENTDINKVMFRNNPYINDLFDEESDVRKLVWDEFYNTKAFINSLTENEKFYLMKPRYKDLVYWNYGHGFAHLHLSKKGTIEMSEYMDCVIPGIKNEYLEGKNIKEVVKMLEDMGVEIPEDNEFIKAINIYDN